MALMLLNIHRLGVACVAALVVGAGSAAAQQATPVAPAVATASPAPACLVSPARVADDQLAAFLSSSSSLLSGFPVGGLSMTGRVRALVGSTTQALSPMMALVANANADQLASIGAGLARAARVCGPINPEYATNIQETVAASGNQALILAYQSALADTQTAALGGGAGGAGAGGAGAGAGGIGGAGAAAGPAGTGTAGTTTTGDAGTASGNSAFSAGASTARFFSSRATTTTVNSPVAQ